MIPLDFNITIGNQNMGFLILIIPIMFIIHFYFLRHSKLRAQKFGNFEAMKRVSQKRILSKNLTPLFFIMIIMSLLVLSLMDITVWIKGDVVSSDYFVVMDSGASMNARDVIPDRFALAKQTAKDVIKNIEGGKIGFIVFGGVIQNSVELTFDKSRIYDVIDNAKIKNTGTDIGLALSSATEGLNPSNNTKTIILISDGHDTVGLPIIKALTRVKEKHIKIFTVGIGTTQGGNFLNIPESEDIISKLNEENLIMLANSTQSIY